MDWHLKVLINYKLRIWPTVLVVCNLKYLANNSILYLWFEMEKRMEQKIEEQLQMFRLRMEAYQRDGKRIFASSSFQSHSIPLLKIIADFDPSIPIYFLNTGFHFPETLQFRDQITEILGLNLQIIGSPVSKINQRGTDGQLMFAKNPDFCCYMNKTLPMDAVLMEHDVWISGLRADQNTFRKNLTIEAPGPHETQRFHAMLHWTSEMINNYIETHSLPQHPLEASGYVSIGCLPCTQKQTLFGSTDERDGRWAGMKKTECGLHTELIDKK